MDFFQRLAELEMRVPGLRELLIDLRSRIDERSSTLAAVTLSLTPTVPLGRPLSPLTPSADAAMTARLREIEDAIERCRRACAGFVEKDSKEKIIREIDDRLTAVR